MDTVRGQALNKPRGRKPRRVPRLIECRAKLWGFDGWRRVGEADASLLCKVAVRFAARLPDSRHGVRTDREARESVLSEHDATTPRGVRWSPVWQRVQMRGSGHGGHGCGGGARMAWARGSACTISIAWPQCRHTKVGGVA